jgi:DNA-binding CsgD family transcriptional regulator
MPTPLPVPAGASASGNGFAPPPAGAGHEASPDTVRGTRRAFEQRMRDLAAVNETLRRVIDDEAHKLQLIMYELALAAERLGDRPLARVIRSVAEQPSNLACVTACGQRGAATCALHGTTACERCRALGTPSPLSAREREVLCLLAEGVRSPCIATQLGIRLATVEVHRRNIMRKLDLHTSAGVTKYALREGLTSL